MNSPPHGPAETGGTIHQLRPDQPDRPDRGDVVAGLRRTRERLGLAEATASLPGPYPPDPNVLCEACGGSRYSEILVHVDAHNPGGWEETVECDACDGYGIAPPLARLLNLGADATEELAEMTGFLSSAVDGIRNIYVGLGALVEEVAARRLTDLDDIAEALAVAVDTIHDDFLSQYEG